MTATVNRIVSVARTAAANSHMRGKVMNRRVLILGPFSVEYPS